MAEPAAKAGKFGDLARRAAAAAILAPVVLWACWTSTMVFAALVALAVIILGREWGRLTDDGGFASWLRLTAPGLAAIVAMLAGQPSLAFLFLAVGFAVAAGWALRPSAADDARGRDAWLLKASGILYIGAPAVALIWLRDHQPDGRGLVIWLLAVVWATDVMAYLIGRALGGPKLAPRLSAGKTWSGALGGVAGAVGIGVLVGTVILPTAGFGETAGAAVLASVIVSLAAQLGDLAESALKRRYAVKDTGTLIPGHGGLMDRVDGLLAAAPIWAILVSANSEGA